MIVLGEYHFFTVWCRKECACFRLVARCGAPESVRTMLRRCAVVTYGCWYCMCVAAVFVHCQLCLSCLVVWVIQEWPEVATFYYSYWVLKVLEAMSLYAWSGHQWSSVSVGSFIGEPIVWCWEGVWYGFLWLNCVVFFELRYSISWYLACFKWLGDGVRFHHTTVTWYTIVCTYIPGNLEIEWEVCVCVRVYMHIRM